MKIPNGCEVYNADASPVVARGVLFSDEQLFDMLSGPVQEIVFDHTGTSDLRDLLDSVTTTAFCENSVKRILDTEQVPRNWRVGEAIAEGFLSSNHDCVFPWPGGRDLKNANASPAGTDLVGFCQSGAPPKVRFAFGEVKTSAQEVWPPSAMDGRHGLRSQIESLRDSLKTKDELVKYLGHHAINASWLQTYKNAAIRYMENPNDVSLFGLLVRDVQPKPQDLSQRAIRLHDKCPNNTSIELRAIYLPKKSISTLGQKIVSLKKDSNGNK